MTGVTPTWMLIKGDSNCPECGFHTVWKDKFCLRYGWAPAQPVENKPHEGLIKPPQNS